MPLHINISVTGDTLTPALRERAMRFDSRRLNEVASYGVANQLRTSLLAINPGRGNKLGGKRTNFYQRAGESVGFSVNLNGSGSQVFVSLLGFRQRYYGGTITASEGKMLAIPVHPDAHGKRPREFNDLEVIHWKGPDGSLKAGLARRDSTSITLSHRKDGTPYYRRAGSHGGEILYIFKKSVNQAGDPSILPPMDQLATAAKEAVESLVLSNGTLDTSKFYK